MEPGTQLGHYEIVSAIGKGGMGEVWRARDTKLGREVAIKTLPPEFAQDADRLARFEREAKLLASLNHPNIAAIYGLEEHEGSRFLVLELVEGDTLGDRIKRGPIPVEEALNLALQIADALKAAHESGVIHRDLKPDNIKVSDDDNVKVLDFGLAKAMAVDATDSAASNSPTLSMAATQAGVILGTAAYMSPEQAKGRAVDRRADVWAFGCVLYEMLSGRQSFGASDVTESLAAVIRSEPEWNTLPANLSPRLRETVERCLEKAVAKRYQDIGDVKVDIQKALAEPSGVFVQPAARVAGGSKLPWLAAVGLTLMASVAVWNLKPDTPGPVTRFSYVLPEGQQFTGRSVLTVSPDGSKIVYAANSQLYARNLDGFESIPIPGTDEDPSTLFFSPDSESIGYWSGEDRQLKRVALSGGTPVPIAETRVNPAGTPDWREDNTIVFTGIPGVVMQVSANGGVPRVIVEPDPSGLPIVRPQILPGGESVLYTVGSGVQGNVVVYSFASGQRTPLFPGISATYVSTGHIVYGAPGGDALFAVPFDPGTLALGGHVRMVEGDLRVGTIGTGVIQYALSESGTLVYATSGSAGTALKNLISVDRQGNEEVIAEAEPRGYVIPRISPEGTHVALDVRDSESNDIFLWDFARNSMTRFTPTDEPDEQEESPLWTRDGNRIAYWMQGGIFWKAANGSGEREPLASASVGAGSFRPFFFPDPAQLVVGALDASNTSGIGRLLIGGNEDFEWLLDSEFDERNAELSPDGNWIAYESDQSGEDEIFVRPYPNVDGEVNTVSNAGGALPVWAKNGQELFYLEPGPPPRLMAVPVQTGDTFDHGTPGEVFEWTYFTNSRRSYDVFPDGQRFLVLRDLETSSAEVLPAQQINVVLNWFEELKERAPVP